MKRGTLTAILVLPAIAFLVLSSLPEAPRDPETQNEPEVLKAPVAGAIEIPNPPSSTPLTVRLPTDVQEAKTAQVLNRLSMKPLTLHLATDQSDTGTSVHVLDPMSMEPLTLRLPTDDPDAETSVQALNPAIAASLTFENTISVPHPLGADLRLLRIPSDPTD